LLGVLALFVGGAAGGGGADPSFAPGPLIQQQLLAVADFNGDGKPDLAVASASNDVGVLLGNGAGAFRAAPGAVNVKDQPYAGAAADFNGDGRMDLAVATAQAIEVLLGDGVGGFRLAPGSPIAAAGFRLVAADLNGDGKNDLVRPTSTNHRNTLTILLGDGSGRFAPAPGSPLAVPGRHGWEDVAIADLNQDGKPDLAGGDRESKQISILLGDGTGRFHAATTVPVHSGPHSIVAGRFDGDSNPDLAVLSSGTVTVLIGDGRGGFRAAPGSQVGVGPAAAIAPADFNRDGRLDLAVASEDGVRVLLGTGAVRLRPTLDSPLDFSADIVVPADLNGDGRPDLVTSETGTLEILWQTKLTPAVGRGHDLRGRPDTVLSTRWLVTDLAADGREVAVAVSRNENSCPGVGEQSGKVVAWTAPGRRSRTFRSSAEGDCAYQLALGDGRIAWIFGSCGNSCGELVGAVKLSGGPVKVIDEAENGNGAGGDPTGSYIDRLLGAGPLLAYNSWEVVCTHTNPQYDYCDRWGQRNDRLLRVVRGRRVVVKHGAASQLLSAVGGGRMAVESAGAITVLDPGGSRVASVAAVAGDPPRAIALSKTHLAVERTFTLDLFNPVTGAKTRSLPLGPAAALQLQGVSAKLALLRGPRRLVLVRLSDGKLISMPLVPRAPSGLVDADLTSAGLFYAYNVPNASRGRVVFERTARLLDRF